MNHTIACAMNTNCIIRSEFTIRISASKKLNPSDRIASNHNKSRRTARKICIVYRIIVYRLYQSSQAAKNPKEKRKKTRVTEMKWRRQSSVARKGDKSNKIAHKLERAGQRESGPRPFRSTNQNNSSRLSFCEKKPHIQNRRET